MTSCGYTAQGQYVCRPLSQNKVIEHYGEENGKCERPSYWCTHKDSVYKNFDCKGNGVLGDHACWDPSGAQGLIMRENGCKSVWPNADFKGAKCVNNQLPVKCERPAGWCSHTGSTFLEVDCKGDGFKGDLVCYDNKGNTGTITRESGCQSVWPNADFSKCHASKDMLPKKCDRPAGWCSHEGATFAQVDCKGDGFGGDLACYDGSGSQGLVARNNNCQSEWPHASFAGCKR